MTLALVSLAGNRALHSGMKAFAKNKNVIKIKKKTQYMVISGGKTKCVVHQSKQEEICSFSVLAFSLLVCYLRNDMAFSDVHPSV